MTLPVYILQPQLIEDNPPMYTATYIYNRIRQIPLPFDVIYRNKNRLKDCCYELQVENKEIVVSGDIKQIKGPKLEFVSNTIISHLPKDEALLYKITARDIYIVEIPGNDPAPIKFIQEPSINEDENSMEFVINSLEKRRNGIDIPKMAYKNILFDVQKIYDGKLDEMIDYGMKYAMKNSEGPHLSYIKEMTERLIRDLQ